MSECGDDLTCPENEREVVHITEIDEDGSYHELHLCPTCAKEYLQKIAHEDEPDRADDEDKPLGKAAGKECPVCEYTFGMFRSTGRLGCPHDYDVFRDELLPLIENIHWGTRHVGKVPKHSPQDVQTRTRILQLRKELEEAVSVEDYERAARLRDEIRILSQEDE